MSFDLDSLSLTEIIRLQNQLSAHIAKRYEQRLALVFTDIIGSTAYFKRFGNEAGRRIQQQHIDILTEAVADSPGRIVDRSGDGAFLTFPNPESAVSCLTRFLRAVSKAQAFASVDHRWCVRVIVHWGVVLSDGNIVTGDAVNLCAKVGTAVRTQEIVLTRSAMHELPKRYSTICRPLDPIQLAGMSEPIEVFQIGWRDRTEIPGRIAVQETGEQIAIPDKPVVSCGRLNEQSSSANDIVLALPDPVLTRRISRWHVELRWEGDRLFLYSVSDQSTEVDGTMLRKGERIAIRCGSVARLSEVMTLRFESTISADSQQDMTLPHDQLQ